MSSWMRRNSTEHDFSDAVSSSSYQVHKEATHSHLIHHDSLLVQAYVFSGNILYIDTRHLEDVAV
jgi:hypothetical protein